MTKKNTIDDYGEIGPYYSELIFESLERTKQALIDNVMLANNEPFRVTETNIERLVVDHLRTRCDHCFKLVGPNKHSAVLVVGTEKLCWCCWFDTAYFNFKLYLEYGMEDVEYMNSPSRARRRAACWKMYP